MKLATRLRPSDVLLAPLRWLERAKGRRRLGLVLLYLLIGAILGLFGWRSASLNALPDVGDPFDVKAYRAAGRVPEGDDAFVLYRAAGDAYRDWPARLAPEDFAEEARKGWAQASPLFRAWIVGNRPALEVWRRAAERPTAGLPSPGSDESAQARNARIEVIGAAVMVEAARLEQEGDRRGAWGWYRAVLRTSDHLRARGTSAARNYAYMMEHQARGKLDALTAGGTPDPALLREALDELRRLDDRTPPLSATFRADYVDVMQALDDPGALVRLDDPSQADLRTWKRARLFLNNEPERSRRIARIAFANWLAQCDRPTAGRPPLASHPTAPRWRLYADDPTAPPAARALTPERFFAWIDSAMLLDRIAHLGPVPGSVLDPAFERRERFNLEVKLAERLYLLDHGRDAQNIEALVPRYLRNLPDGYVPAPAAMPPSGDAQGP